MLSRRNRLKWLGIMLVPLFLTAPGLAQPKKKEPPKVEKIDGRLIVEDFGAIFSADAVKKAKGFLAEIRDASPREFYVIALKELSESQRKEYDKLEGSARARFFAELAKDQAKVAKARGVFVLICKSPGYVSVLADKAIRDKGFTLGDEQRVKDLILEKLRESTKAEKDEEKAAIRDKGLLNAAEFVRDAYKKMAR